MAKRKSGTAIPGDGGFYWSRFSSCEVVPVIRTREEVELVMQGVEPELRDEVRRQVSRQWNSIKCEGEVYLYLLSTDIAPRMLASFLKVKDSQSVVKYLEEYGAPLNFPASDIDLETILGLANSLRAVMGLIDLVHDESVALSDSIDLTELPPWNRCEEEFNSLSYSHILKSKLRAQYPGTDHWVAFVECYRGAKAKEKSDCSDLERLVLAFYKDRELKKGLWWVPRVKEHFYSGNLRFVSGGFLVTELVPESVFRLPCVSSKDWKADKERQARYVFGNALKQWFDVLLSGIHPTLIWNWSAESNDWVLTESFSLDTPWNLMCMELLRTYLGTSKYSYCSTCREPYIRGAQAKGCSNACKQKRYRERKNARKEGK